MMTAAELLARAAARGVELRVEGARLRVKDPGAQLSADERAELRARRSEVTAALREQGRDQLVSSPLSYNQRSLWLIAQEAPDSPAYNVALAVRIGAEVDPRTIQEALQGLVDRHAMLRTTYHLAEDGQLEQRTVGSEEVVFERYDVVGLSDALLKVRIESDCKRPFDLERGPVFRSALYSRAANEHVLSLCVHHIAADGWSLAVLLEDFGALQAEAAGLEVKVPALPEARYVDFVELQSRLLESPEGQRLEQYWTSRLNPLPLPIPLPTDRPRPPLKSFRGATRVASAGSEVANGLRRVAREQSTTLFVVLLAAFDAMLFRLTGAEDLVVGTPMSGRTRPEFSRAVGYFVNPVPLRTAVQAGMSFRALLASVREAVREAIAAQQYPLSLIVQHAQAPRTAGRSPLFEIFFGLLSTDAARSKASSNESARSELALGEYPLRQMEGQFDLSLQVLERESSLDIELKYNTDLFDGPTAQGFLDHYGTLLRGAAQDPEALLEALGADESVGQPEPHAIDVFLSELAARDIRVTLDGDKLRLNAPSGAVDDELKRALAKRKPEIVAALRAALPARGPLQQVPRTPPLPLSFAQQRLWVFDRMQPGTAHYNIAVQLRITGTLDRPAMSHALDALIHRHESLRTCIRAEDGQPRAEIKEYPGSAVRFVDLSGSREPEPEVKRLAKEFGTEPFDLAQGPMAKFLLMRLSAEESRLVVCVHHIASDGWSLSVAVREICAVYASALEGKPSPLPALSIQYVDYAAWQRHQLNSGLFARQLSYWQRELAGAPTLLELPTDRPRPLLQSFRGKRRSLRMPAALLEQLNAFSLAHQATLYMTLLAAFQVLLARYSGQDDVVVGSPVANRDRIELESLIGCFVNNIVLRGRLEGNPRFVDFLAQVKSTVLRAFDHRDLPFDRIVEAVRPERTTSHHPIFQCLFTLHSFPMQVLRPAGLEIEAVDDGVGDASSRFDLTLELDPVPDGMRLVYEYVADLFDAERIERIHGQYLKLLQEVIADAKRPVRDIPLLTADDERVLLDDVNATRFEHDRTRCVHDWVRAVAERTPESLAVEAEDASLSYAALEQRANQLAHLLRAQGVARGSLVGVCLDRTSFLPVALLAVLKAGAAYVPVDPSHPPERLSYTLLDAEVACVVTERRFTSAVAAANVPLVFVDDEAAWAAVPNTLPEVTVEASDLAYVIYTSGSTGRPKGVEIEHRNVVNFLEAMQREPGYGAADVLLAVTTPSFDIAGLEIFLPLVSGGRTVIASRGEVLDGERLRERIETCGATMLQATPATFRLLIDSGWEGTARLVALCGGEALPRDLARALLSRVRSLWNMYGPTETTVWSTVQELRDADSGIPIGHPILNTTVYVLDAAGQPVPLGVAGELCIGGEGVARGYRQRPELTDEKFVRVSLAGRAPERVYRTGDVVRLRNDLALEFVGRRDHQVKLRGYRIELGEIESVLAEHPAVRRNVVMVREDVPGDQRLVAYVVAADAGAALPEEELRTQLRTRLPEYMVPSAIVPLDDLPLTPNGKIDRKALPAPSAARVAGPAFDVMMTEPQRKVAAVWCAVLRVERVGLHQNFFDLGGHSLLVIRVHAALKREFGVELTVVDLFQRTTVAAQAELLAEGDRNAGLQRARDRLARQAVDR